MFRPRDRLRRRLCSLWSQGARVTLNYQLKLAPRGLKAHTSLIRPSATSASHPRGTPETRYIVHPLVHHDKPTGPRAADGAMRRHQVSCKYVC